MASNRLRAPLGVAAALLTAATLAPAPAPSAAAAPTPAPATAASPVASGPTGWLGEVDGAWRSDKDLGSLYTVSKGAGVHDLRSRNDALGRKLTGKNVGVALIDSGVARVKGLDDARIVDGPDLSFESQAPNLAHLDTFGHGTHMAGIIAGRDPEVLPGKENDSKHFVGVAPDANLLSIKVATDDGATDVSQVIAAIDWVVAHRNDPGMNIRVLNLSYGTDSTQSYLFDPLAHAVENAWRKGIVVVVAAGNEGNQSSQLTNPAIDPFVLAVGAADHAGTVDRKDDTVATFSSRGSFLRPPDLVAPGRSLVSLRDPGSSIDQENPSAVVTGADGPRYFRGSGSSQAAAFTSGAVALLLQQRPDLTPDEVKEILTSSADRIDGVERRLQGSGLIDVAEAGKTPTPWYSTQWHLRSTGLGSLEAARGTSHVADPEDGTELVGEQDIFGQPWDGRSWAYASAQGRSWAGGTWNGSVWTGDAWSGRSWAGATWTGVSWAGRSWAGRSWADNVWDGRSWAGRSWAGRSWAGRSWAGRSWASGDMVGSVSVAP